MSPTLEDRVQAWRAWFAANIDYTGRWGLTAYEHQCGALGNIGEDLGDIWCPGCRFIIQRPETECEPLYRRVNR